MVGRTYVSQSDAGWLIIAQTHIKKATPEKPALQSIIKQHFDLT